LKLFNWLRYGIVEISVDGTRFRRIFEFIETSNGVARVEFRQGVEIKSLRIIAAEQQDAWLMIEDIELIVDERN